MDEIKNINSGNLNSEGGPIHIGDKYINDLSTAYNQVYKEQVTAFESLLHSFQPKTAKQLLERLEIDISQKERIEDIVKSKIAFLKATCDGFLDVKADELSVSLINAYKLNKSDFKLKEIACLEYLKIEELDKSSELVEEILAIEEYNPIAWAVKALVNSSTSLENALSEVPDIVRKNSAFRRVIYFLSKRTNKFDDLHIAFPKFQILMNLDDYDKTPLSFQNYKDRIFLIESLLSLYSQSIWITFNRRELENREELTKVYEILSEFVKDISNTEIQSSYPNIQFFAAYFNYQINSDIQSVHEMVKCYQSMPVKPLFQIMLTANSLQQIDEVDEAVEIIEEQEDKDPILIDLMMFCQIKRNDGPTYLKYVREYLTKVKTVTIHNIHNYFFVPQTLRDFGLLNDIDVSEFTKDKTFESEELKNFLVLYIDLLKGERRDGIIDELIVLYDQLSESNESILVFFAICFHLLENHEKCCEVYERFVRTDIEHSDLYSYILALFRSKNRHKDLLPLLLKWRTNFSFDEQLVRMEIELRRQLFHWNEVIACCEYMFNQQIFNEFNLINYAIAIHESDITDKDEKIQVLLSNLERTTIKNYNSYSTIIAVLERSNFHDEALQLLFSKAQEKSNAQARTEYFNFTSFRDQKYLESYPEVKEGVFLKFKMDEAIVYDELTAENEYLEHLIGKKIGDEVILPGKYGGEGNKITILRIMNKYLSLYDEIMEEVRTNPLSKIPMQSFDMSEYIDGKNGKSILEFFEKIGGKRTPEELEQNFNAYYDHEVTFTHLVSLEYSENYLKAYYNLTKERQGLTQVNPLELGIVTLKNYNEFILDFTSLLQFYELSKSTGFALGIKFTVTSSLVSLIKTYSTEFPPVSGKDYVLDKKYYDELLTWINENCQAKMPFSKLDAVAMAKENKKMSVIHNYGLDNCCLLLDNANALLITDDFFYFKMFEATPGKVISPWLFTYLMSLGSDQEQSTSQGR